jgi:hypothetical protein
VIGVSICFSPLILLLASVVVSIEYPRQSGLGLGLSVAGFLLAGLNFYLAVIRPSLYVWRHGSTGGLRNISGLPMVGTCLVVAGGIVGFCDWRAAVVGVVALVMDFGGLPWFLIATWHDESMWDA